MRACLCLYMHVFMTVYISICVCVCVRVSACVRACVRACVAVRMHSVVLMVKFMLSSYTALCTPPCQNGGICKSPNKCLCVPGYLGSTCNITGVYVCQKV